MSQEKKEPVMAHPNQNNQKEPKKSKATVVQSILIGSVAGATEVLVDHPLWSIKTRLQRGEKFTCNPSVLYRGILPNAASMVPITAMQVGLNRLAQRLLFQESTTLTDLQRISCAFVAGLGSSFVSCPTEMVMTHQGKSGGSFYGVGRYLLKEGGWPCIYRGLGTTGIREGMFTTFFLAGTPIIKAKVKPYCKDDNLASVIAGMGAGVGATLASQAFDTLKTVQQDAPVSQPLDLFQATKKVHSTGGFYGFFKGGIPRGARVVSAVTIMGFVNEKMEALFNEHNSAENAVNKKTL